MRQLPLEFQALKQIAELSDEAVLVYNVTTEEVVYSNALALRWFGVHPGISLSDLLSFYEKLPPEDKAYLKSHYLSAVKKSAAAQSEFRLPNEHGKFTVVCCTTYLLDSNVVVFIRDITRPKSHEDYLVEFGARKNSVLDILIHHLSGALHLMKNLSAEASKHVNDSTDKNLKVYFELLDSNNARCLEVINDLLKNEHERSPRVVVKGSRIDIVSKIYLVYDEFRKNYKHRLFEFEHALESFFITTDEIKLLQIVNNLVSNAIKFSPNARPIVIRISEVASDIVVSVRDEGMGIPDSLTPFIFDRQSIAGRVGLNGETPTGFGLSICKKLTDLLGGKIWFETEVDKGSTFYFSLPKK